MNEWKNFLFFILFLQVITWRGRETSISVRSRSLPPSSSRLTALFVFSFALGVRRQWRKKGKKKETKFPQTFTYHTLRPCLAIRSWADFGPLSIPKVNFYFLFFQREEKRPGSKSLSTMQVRSFHSRNWPTTFLFFCLSVGSWVSYFFEYCTICLLPFSPLSSAWLNVPFFHIIRRTKRKKERDELM